MQFYPGPYYVNEAGIPQTQASVTLCQPDEKAIPVYLQMLNVVISAEVIVSAENVHYAF